MPRIDAQSEHARKTYDLVQALQARLVKQLEATAKDHQAHDCFRPLEWLRAGGKFGGGRRFVAQEGSTYNRASVNVSQVHYDSAPEKALGSATALSTIIHPTHPLAPSIHMHISWTQLKSGKSYWRLMADLNPSYPREADTKKFDDCLRSVAPEQYKRATEQGDRYFYIPALARHRGVKHFYLEEYTSGDYKADYQLAKTFGEAVSDCYVAILTDVLNNDATSSAEDQKRQLDYHTLYFFQVLTLDRGTTSGLLVHDDNDVGILGSLPAQINRELLSSWLGRLSGTPLVLLQRLLDTLPADSPCAIDDLLKSKLAGAVRDFYRQYPEATEHLARGDVIASTTTNHR